jgi:hypothetical protein
MSAEKMRQALSQIITQRAINMARESLAEHATQAQAVPQVGRNIDKQAEFEAWLENYPIQIIEDDYELCFDAFMAGLAARGIGGDQQ